MPHFNFANVEYFESLFDSFDEDEDGLLSKEELRFFAYKVLTKQDNK